MNDLQMMLDDWAPEWRVPLMLQMVMSKYLEEEEMNSAQGASLR